MSILLPLLFFLGSSASHAGIGGSGGGPTPSSKYVTVEVCGMGDSETQCQRVTYKVRPPSPVQDASCSIVHGEAHEVPCPTVYGIPDWLNSLPGDPGN